MIKIDLIISAIAHRTGSTLLQRICNTRKKTLIWGEHSGIITKFCNIYNEVSYFSKASVNERKAYFENDENPNNWIADLTPDNNYVESAIIKSIQSFINTLYSEFKEGHDIIGFKEVRYGEEELNMLRRCYPDTVFFLLVRNPVDIWKSAPNWLRSWPEYKTIDVFINTWNKKAEYYHCLDKKDKNAYLIRYEDIITKNDRAINLIAKLVKLDTVKIDEVLEKKIGSTKDKKISQEDKEQILQGCKKNLDLLEYNLLLN